MTLRPWGKWEPFLSSRACIITCMLLPRNMALVWPCMIFEEKASISSFLVILTALSMSVGSLMWFAVVSLLMESSAQWQVNRWDILNPFIETGNSSILLSLIMSMIWFIGSVPKMSSTWEAKSVGSGMTRVTWSSSYPTPLPLEPLWKSNPRVWRIVCWSHSCSKYHRPGHSTEQHRRNRPHQTLGSLHWS